MLCIHNSVLDYLQSLIMIVNDVKDMVHFRMIVSLINQHAFQSTEVLFLFF